MGRAPCCDKMGLKKGPWTPQEDQILVQFIQKNGHGNWRALPKQAGLLRCGKSCRLRWINYLRPDIKRGNFSAEEEEAIIKLHQLLGNRWSAIASRLPGRTDNEIKNVWNTHLKKRLLRMGIDPVTHAVTEHSVSHTGGHSLISLDYSEYCKGASPSMEEDSLGLCQPKASADYSEYSQEESPSMENSLDLCQPKASVDYPEYSQGESPSMEENSLGFCQAKASVDYSEYSHGESPSMEENSLGLCQAKASVDCSEYSLGASPSMEENSLALCQAKAWAESPTRVSNFPDTIYDSQNLSNEILSSINSTDSDVISGDSSGSSLDWLQSSCISSFDEPLGYDQRSSAIEDERFIFENQDFTTEISTFEAIWDQSSNGEDQNFMSACSEDDFLSSIDGADTNPHFLRNIELQTTDDDSDGTSYWLNVLSQARSLPTLL